MLLVVKVAVPVNGLFMFVIGLFIVVVRLVVPVTLIMLQMRITQALLNSRLFVVAVIADRYLSPLVKVNAVLSRTLAFVDELKLIFALDTLLPVVPPSSVPLS